LINLVLAKQTLLKHAEHNAKQIVALFCFFRASRLPLYARTVCLEEWRGGQSPDIAYAPVQGAAPPPAHAPKVNNIPNV
jgi:hypothetical protein